MRCSCCLAAAPTCCDTLCSHLAGALVEAAESAGAAVAAADSALSQTTVVLPTSIPVLTLLSSSHLAALPLAGCRALQAIRCTWPLCTAQCVEN